MATPLRPKTPVTRIKENSAGVAAERRKPVLPGVYIYVGTFVAEDDPGNDPPVTTWQSVPWQNGWTWVDPFYVGFRHGIDGETEFIGVVDTTAATSGTVAFTLPLPWHPTNGRSYSFITDLDLGGGQFNAARVFVDTNGEVTIYFPINP